MGKVINRVASAFEEKGLDYTKTGASMEIIAHGNHMCDIHIVINQGYTGKGVSVGVYDIATVAEGNQYKTAFVLNSLNNTFQFFKFYIDNNRKVNCCYDVSTEARNIGAICVDICQRIVAVVDYAYRKIVAVTQE